MWDANLVGVGYVLGAFALGAASVLVGLLIGTVVASDKRAGR